MRRRNLSNHYAQLGTRVVWSGENGMYWERTTQVPVALGVAFGYDDVEKWLAVAQGKSHGHIYSRNTNPTVAAFEEKVRDLETTESATSFASGMGAISNTLFALLSPGDRVVSINDTYGGTNKLFIEFLPHFGIKVSLAIRAITKQSRQPSAKGARQSTLKVRRTQRSKLSISVVWQRSHIATVRW